MPLRHVLRNALRPGYLPVMADKVLTRIRDRPHAREAAEVRAWYEEVAEDRDAWARQIDEAAWDASREVAARVRAQGQARLAELGQPMGGAGDVALLHFLVRTRVPEVVVETGVAAGFSSFAILTALEANGRGHLWSSDFPYVRLPDPARLVGNVVPGALRGRWTLLLEGDARNLRQIARLAPPIDLLHYDSDKSYIGRKRALDILRLRLRPGAAVVFDDIQDNAFFRDLVRARGGPFHVFAVDGKLVGLIPRW